MSNDAINRRKSVLFLTQISPVYDTHDELVRKKLKKGKFPQTKTGIIKMVSLCFQLGGIISWIVLERTCNKPELTCTTLICSVVAFAGQLILFLLISLGKITKNPGYWINFDITFNFLSCLLVIGTSVATIKICKSTYVEDLSAVLLIGGSVLTIVGCAALFLLYRFVEDSEEGDKKNALPRKSIFA